MSDYVNEDELQAHLAKVVPLKRDQAIAAEVELRRGKFARERFVDIEPHATEWLVKHFLPASGVAIIYGASTVGKSFVSLYFCLRIALGKPILKHKSRRAGIVYVAAEGQNGMRKRIKGLREQFSIETGAFQFIGVAPNLLERADIEALAEEVAAADAEMKEAADVGVGLIVIDTTAASMPGGNENTSEGMGLALANAQWLGQQTGALVLLVAHPGKNETLGVRGWSGQTGNVDAIIYLQQSENPDDPDLRLGRVQKLKDGEDGERFAYRLKRISMGSDEDGDAITTAYPVFEDPPSDEVQGRRKRPVEQKPGPSIILRAMGKLLDAEQGEIVSGVPGVPPGTIGVDRLKLRERAVLEGYADPDTSPDSLKAMINRDIRELIAARKLRAEGPLIWVVR